MQACDCGGTGRGTEPAWQGAPSRTNDSPPFVSASATAASISAVVRALRGVRVTALVLHTTAGAGGRGAPSPTPLMLAAAAHTKTTVSYWTRVSDCACPSLLLPPGMSHSKHHLLWDEGELVQAGRQGERALKRPHVNLATSLSSPRARGQGGLLPPSC